MFIQGIANMIWRYARAHERSRAEKFQSTPPCVGDSKYPRSSSMVEPFQFMPLCGGRPGTYSTAFTPTKFQPTPPPPCVGRLPQPAPVRYLCLISTHAPRVWGDGHTTLQLLDTANFNPRPPCGGRPLSALSPAVRLYFNPRPPCGGRLKEINAELKEYQFQPTPPVWGATSQVSTTPRRD